MTDEVLVAASEALPDKNAISVWVDDVELALFKVDNEWFAVDGRCPHQGASLADGCLEATTVSCPWHGWKFDLRTGQGDRPQAKLRTFAIRLDEQGLWIDRTNLKTSRPERTQQQDGIHRALIRYGRLGWVGVFGTVDAITCQPRDWVVVQTDRGPELGEVLLDPTQKIPVDAKPTGELLRLAQPDDRTTHLQRQSLVDTAIAAANRHLQTKTLPVDVIDGELLVDGETLILYYVGEFQSEFAELRTRLAIGLKVNRVDLHPLIEPTGGSCGTGGCGSCASH